MLLLAEFTTGGCENGGHRVAQLGETDMPALTGMRQQSLSTSSQRRSAFPRRASINDPAMFMFTNPQNQSDREHIGSPRNLPRFALFRGAVVQIGLNVSKRMLRGQVCNNCHANGNIGASHDVPHRRLLPRWPPPPSLILYPRGPCSRHIPGRKAPAICLARNCS